MSEATAIDPLILTAEEHGIAEDLVCDNATTVVRELKAAGFEAYLVGGCVRDLLLGMKPKDFDVATSATPEEVEKLFRRARMIGRRFRIAHVRFGRDVIEVSTFRKHHEEEDDLDEQTSSRSEDGLMLRDNSYGTLEDDVFRRDFTVNALYYDPLSEELHDYAGGLDDLKAKRLRLIGKPTARFREDPVRILRAVRFTAKLDFTPDEDLLDAIPEIAELLTAIPPARLFDEVSKLLLHGWAERTWQIMSELELAQILFPTTEPDSPLIHAAMRNTDARVAEGKPVTPGFLLAVILWDDYQGRVGEILMSQSLQVAEQRGADSCVAEQNLTVAIPRRFGQFVKETWMLQPRLEKKGGKGVQKLMKHPRFRAAYDFLSLRAECGYTETELVDYWTEIQEKHPVTPDPDTSEDDGEGGERRSSGGKRRRGRRRGGSANRSGGDGNSSGGSPGNSSGDTPNAKQPNSEGGNGNTATGNSDAGQEGSGERKPKRRRRRRRRSSSGNASSSGGNGNANGNS